MNNLPLSMQQRCDELTASGAELSLTWQGGGDEGCFDLLLDEKPLEEQSELEQEIIHFMEEAIGYGSFAGEFYTEGKLVYNHITKCFGGTDNYSDSEGATRECQIAIHVPEHIWFEHLVINIRVEYEDANPEVSIEPRLRNGPLPPELDRLIAKWERYLRAKFATEIDQLEDFEFMAIELIAERSQFTVIGDILRFEIDAFDYSKSVSSEKELSIYFTEEAKNLADQQYTLPL
ncbi:hypothetical protein [Pedobacter chitinilyticus]|uniref:Uncharacterized protein n=1 Tax=Pedobacter chitinilyticus TaxID=2233776 RepID=A0A443YW18_9SPHI|nr:hypothetical protein [Pedobacter chitinilyticus]RWU08175.1 hypothetical protein DPV69_07275 [Pedobacter chitinilyticus]